MQCVDTAPPKASLNPGLPRRPARPGGRTILRPDAQDGRAKALPIRRHAHLLHLNHGVAQGGRRCMHKSWVRGIQSPAVFGKCPSDWRPSCTSESSWPATDQPAVRRLFRTSKTWRIGTTPQLTLVAVAPFVPVGLSAVENGVAPAFRKANPKANYAALTPSRSSRHSFCRVQLDPTVCSESALSDLFRFVEPLLAEVASLEVRPRRTSGQTQQAGYARSQWRGISCCRRRKR